MIDTVIVHSISLPPERADDDEICRFFSGQLDCAAHPYYRRLDGVRVSSHFYISRAGIVIQLVPVPERAWHAGHSALAGRESVNDFSVGIELAGLDCETFTPSQYRSLGHVVAALMRRFPAIDAARVVGHEDIAPGRKSDPGPGFNWPYFRSLVPSA